MVMLQLNISWIANYAVKAAGMLFMLGGVTEISAFCKGFSRLRASAMITLGVNIAGIAALCIAALVHAGAAAVNIISVPIGVLSFILIYLFVKEMIKLLLKNNALVNDESNIRRLSAGFNHMMILASASLVCEIINRIAGTNALGDFMGVIVFVVKIAAYVYLISTGLTFNKIRCDFNMKHSAETYPSDE